MKKTNILLMMLVALFATALTSCDALNREKQLIGTWETSYTDDSYPATSSYTFNNDNTFEEVVEIQFPEGTLKLVSPGTFKVKNGVVEFMYDLDECKAYADGEFDESLTESLVNDNRKENDKTNEFRKENNVYGFKIVKVDQKTLVLSTSDQDELTYTKQ